MSEHSEIWHFRLPNGDSREGTLEQLDEAFHVGAIDETTLVRREGTSEWVTLAVAAGLEAAPATAPMPSAPPPPVVSDLDDLSLDLRASARSSKRGVFVGLAAAVAVFAAAGVFVVRTGSQEGGVVKAAGVSAGANLAGASAPVSPASDVDTDGKGRTLTDEQKRALLGLDKAREAEAQKKRAQQAPRHASPPPMKTGSPFAKGGSKFDPLNSSL